jgi:N-acetylmuramoyl-L-alanine amidase
MLNALGFDSGKEDGIFGRRTADGVMEFQRNLADRVDGIVGLDTVRSLERMRPAVGGPGLAVVREEEAVRSMEASLEGSILAVDAADEPARDDLGLEIAMAVATALEARGATPVSLRRAEENPDPSERARTANAVEAAACISIRLAAEGPSGAATCAYWGTATTHSPAGRRLAELIQAGLASVGLRDEGIRPLGIALLRETRMPAVQVEPGRLSSEQDRERLADPSFQRALAGAIAEAVGRFLAGSAV